MYNFDMDEDQAKYIAFLQNTCSTAWSEHAFFAIELVKLINPKIVVDLGVDEGYSTFCFAYPKKGMIYGVDHFYGDEFVGEKQTLRNCCSLLYFLNIKRGIDNVLFIPSDFDELARHWEKHIDILHIDGNHNYESVKNDFKNWEIYTSEKAVILLHDVLSHESVNKFFNEIEGYHKFIRPQSHGLGICCKNKKLLEKIKQLSLEIEN